MIGSNPLMNLAVPTVLHANVQQAIHTKKPESQLLQAVNFVADYSGCGHWRMLWPEQHINLMRKGEIRSGSVACADPNWFGDVKTIRIQRQGHPNHIPYIKWIYNLCHNNNIKLIYEIDDIAIAEDIPDYNKFKDGFTSDAVRNGIIDVMSNCHEISVTCQYMKDYYIDKTGNKNVTVLPNYMQRNWIGLYYNEKQVSRNFDKNKKKPRILYPGSPTHFDTTGRAKFVDDLTHANDAIIKTRKQFQWVFFGGYSKQLEPYVKSGEIEYHRWVPLYNYPETAYNLNCQAMIAPLQDNTFNRGKSNIKLLEGAALGLPVVAQDMVTYSGGSHLFTTGDEMIDQLKQICSSKDSYMKLVRKGRDLAKDNWLENPDNIGKYIELYAHPYGSKERILLNKLNNI